MIANVKVRRVGANGAAANADALSACVMVAIEPVLAGYPGAHARRTPEQRTRTWFELSRPRPLLMTMTLAGNRP